MTLSTLITKLAEIQAIHGPDVEVVRFSEDWGEADVEEVRYCPQADESKTGKTVVIIL